MARYLVPGIYSERSDLSAKALEGVGTSTAGFIGLAERGPVMGRPVRLTSFADYRRWFGGYLSEQSHGAYRYLPNAVEQFFVNGGSTCYVMRVAPKDAACAKGSKGPVIVRAVDPGAWANTMQVSFVRSTRARTQILEARSGENGEQYLLEDADGFRTGDLVACRADGGAAAYYRVAALDGRLASLYAELPGDETDTAAAPGGALEACSVDVTIRCGEREERYPGCSLDPAAPDYLAAALGGSGMAVVTLDLPDCVDDPLVLLGGTAETKSLCIELSGGRDGTMSDMDADVFSGVDLGPGKRSGIEAFREAGEVSVMAVPGVTDAAVQAKLIAHCEELTSRFAVLDAPLSCTSVDDLARRRSAYDTSYAALYAPWVQAYDPPLQRSDFLPPSGFICGVYARTDDQRGVHKAPANEVVQGCTGSSARYSDAEQGTLVVSGVNLIRDIPGLGVRVWSARTCSSDSVWKYVNIRRLFIFLEGSIRASIRWAASEPNDEELWSRVRRTIALFLETQRQKGALAGAAPEQAYHVDVGHSTMTRDDILHGRLVCEIGAAPVRPSEFVVFRVTQDVQPGT